MRLHNNQQRATAVPPTALQIAIPGVPKAIPVAITSDDHCTPEEVFGPALDLCRGQFDLDPCTNANSIVPALDKWTRANGTNSLLDSWGSQSDTVWCNWPYSDNAHWAEKVWLEGRRGVQVFALCPAAVDTRWFQNYCATADAICFWRGRITFLGSVDPAPFASAVVYFGRDTNAFVKAYSPLGWTVKP